MDRVVTINQQQVLRVAARHGAVSVRVFGSRARGDVGPSSDLDLLVEFAEGRSLLDAIALEQELGDLLGFPVQVLTPSGLSPHLRDRILATAVAL